MDYYKSKLIKVGFVIIIIILAIWIIKIKISETVQDNKINTELYKTQWGVNLREAKQIQNALAQYYADYDNYPEDKNYNKALKGIMGTAPCYKNGSSSIKKYKRVNINRKNESYKIYFYDDIASMENESRYILTDGTDTYQWLNRKK